MLIRNSILAGEILSLLENVSGSVRIIDIETALQTTEKDVNSAVARLHTEGLIDLIKEDERNTITLTESEITRENIYFK